MKYILVLEYDETIGKEYPIKCKEIESDVSPNAEEHGALEILTVDEYKLIKRKLNRIYKDKIIEKKINKRLATKSKELGSMAYWWKKNFGSLMDDVKKELKIKDEKIK